MIYDKFLEVVDSEIKKRGEFLIRDTVVMAQLTGFFLY